MTVIQPATSELLALAAVMRRLVAAGFTHEAAHKIARAEGPVCVLAPGIRVTVRCRTGGQR